MKLRIKVACCAVCMLGCAAGSGADGGGSGASASATTTGEGTDASTTATSTGGPSTGTGPAGTGSGSSGTTTGGATGSSGGSTTSVEPCEPWRVDVPGVTLEHAVFDGAGRVHVVGTGDDDVGRVLTINGCNGEVLRQTTVALPNGTFTRLHGVAVRGPDLYVAGGTAVPNDPGQGFYARLGVSDLEVAFTQQLFGSNVTDSINDVEMTVEGRAWMVGQANLGGVGTARSWGVSGDAAGSACGFAWPTGSPGSARAVASVGAEMHTIAEAGGGMYLLRFDASCTCMCQPTFASPGVLVGAVDTEPQDLVAIGGVDHVVGWAGDVNGGADTYGFVRALDPTDGTVVGGFDTDTSALGDPLVAGATDGVRLYVGGAQNQAKDPDQPGALARIYALPLPLPVNAAPLWSMAPPNLDGVHGLVVDAVAERIVVVGRFSGDGVVASCDIDGNCAL